RCAMSYETRAFRRRLASACVGAMLALSIAPASAADEDVLATVNGAPITAGELDLLVDDLSQQLSALPDDQRRAAALTYLVEVRLITEAAMAAGMDKTEEFQRRAEQLRQRALHSGYIEAEVAEKITDEALRAR